jgi:hypothetical protein
MSRRRERARPCVTPSKWRYASIDEARADYLRQVADPELAYVTVHADWAYVCLCGAWHRTSRHDPHLGGVPL